MDWFTKRRIGLLFILAALAIYTASRSWLHSRDYLPLEVPIDLVAGKTTHEFVVNMNGNYDILIAVEEVPEFREKLGCFLWGCPEQPAALHATWELRQRGRLVAQGNSDDLRGDTNFGYHDLAKQLGSPHLTDGTYSLVLNATYAEAVLAAGRPRLAVLATGDTYESVSRIYGVLLLLSCALAGLGIAIALMPLRQIPPVEIVPEATSHAKGSELAPANRAERFPIRPRYVTGISYWPLAATIFFCLMMFVMMVVHLAFNPMPHGYWVNVAKSAAEIRASAPYDQPIIVRVSFAGPHNFEEHFHLNGEDLPEYLLKIKLREILVTRADRTVYVVGDENISFEAVAHAIDAVNQSYASRVVLLTTNGVPEATKRR